MSVCPGVVCVSGGSALNSHKVPEKESLRCWNVLVHKTSCEEKQKAWPWTTSNTFRMNYGAGCEPDRIPHISADALVSEWDQIPAGGSTCSGGKMAFSVFAAGVTLIHSVRLIFQHNHKNTRPCFWPVYSESLVFMTETGFGSGLTGSQMDQVGFTWKTPERELNYRNSSHNHLLVFLCGADRPDAVNLISLWRLTINTNTFSAGLSTNTIVQLIEITVKLPELTWSFLMCYVIKHPPFCNPVTSITFCSNLIS